MCLKIILKFDNELDKDYYLDALRSRFGARYHALDVRGREWEPGRPLLQACKVCDLLVIEHARSANDLVSKSIIRWCDRRDKILVLCDTPLEAPPTFDGLLQAIHLHLHGHGIASYSECQVGNGTLRLPPESFANAIETMHRVAELYTSQSDLPQSTSRKKQCVSDRRLITSRRYRSEESEANHGTRNQVVEFL